MNIPYRKNKNKKSFDDIRNKDIEIASTEEIEKELEHEKYRVKYKNTFKSTVSILIVTCAIAVLIATLWCPVLRIFGTSMSPTLSEGQTVVSIKTVKVETGDVIGVYYGNKILVKRIIATSGQWVDIDKEGNVYVDNQAIAEPYISKKALGECDIVMPYQVPENTMFVMGDHRESSVDSRSTAIGCISDEEVVGKIILCIWPFKEFGPIK